MKSRVVDLTSREDLMQKSVAEATARILLEKYPGHMWAVGWQGGSLWFKDRAISDEYGMWLHPELAASFSEYRMKVIRFGGELLERADMIRGAWNGERALVLEGAEVEKFAMESKLRA